MNFDRLAPHYRWLEGVTAGGLLQRVRTTWLDSLHDRRRVLLVGVGRAPFAEALLRRYPQCELVCVDASAAMLARARRRIAKLEGAARRVTWLHASVPEWRPPPGTFDAIVTCFFLDCFPRPLLAEIIAMLAQSAAPAATWIVADFALPARGPARWRARGIHALMYAFFRWTTALPARRLTPPEGFIRAHGFQLRGRRSFSWGLLRADLWRRENA